MLAKKFVAISAVALSFMAALPQNSAALLIRNRTISAAAQNVRFWHKADITAVLIDVRFRG
jgi:hypothetical protein